MELQNILNKIDQLKQRLEQLGPLSNEAKERLAQKVRIDWNYHSNVIEGNTLSYGETKSLLLFNLTANGKSLKDHLDMKGHNEALKKLEQLANKEIKISENLIKEFHKIILIDPYKDHPDVEVGKYKRKSNYLYNDKGERVDFLAPEDVSEELNELINWVNNSIFVPKRSKEKYNTHPLLIAATFHLRFINIHPFDDGNGRVCRIMMNIILMQCGFPPVVIRQEERQEYFRAIEKARNEGPEILAEFIGNGLIRSLELYLRAAEGKAIEEPGDLEKELALLKQQLQEEEDVRFFKSNELILKLYDACFRNLFQKLHDKLLQFDDLFLDKHEHLIPGNLATGKEKINYLIMIDNEFDRIRRNLLNKDNPNFIDFIEETSIDIISYRLYWEGFKKNKNDPFNIYTSLVIQFEKMKYIITPERGEDQVFEPISKLYHEIITEEEMDFIANALAKNVLSRIKSKLNLK